MSKFWRSGMIDKKIIVERDMFNAYCGWLKNRGPYDSDLKFEKQTFGDINNENNTRTLRQEE